MFIVDCILKRIFPQKFGSEYDYDPLKKTEEDDSDCVHEFLPVDSTGEVLACIKCGFIIRINNNNDLKE